jgi:type IV pilus assembly protein PilO
MTVTRKWSLLAAVLVAAIFVASWFLLISPKRGEAAQLRDEAAAQDTANTQLEQQIQTLISQQKDLPKQQALLAQIRRQLPTNPALPSLIRDLTAASRTSGIVLESLSPTDPVAVAAPVVAPPVATEGEAATEEGAATEESAATEEGAATEDGAATEAAPVVPPAPSLFQVPVGLEATGTYFELEQFINKIEDLKRSFLVTGFTLKTEEGEDGATDALTLTISGRVFIAPPAEEVAPAAVAPATTTPAPAVN